MLFCPLRAALVSALLPLTALASPPFPQANDSSAPTLGDEIQLASALYAAEPAPDPHKAIRLDDAPSELDGLYAALAARTAPLVIRTFPATPSAPQAPDSTALGPTTFAPGSAEDIMIRFIRRFEAGRSGYDAVWHGNRTPLPARPTGMTVCEVRDWQLEAGRRQLSTAIGLYQFVGGTFRRLLAEMDLSCTTPFDSHTQDRMGLALLHSRGWEQFKAGTMTVENFGFELAGEWAAFPAPYGEHKGFSRYRRVAGNRHQVELPAFLAFLRELRGQIAAGALPDKAEDAPPALPPLVFVEDRPDRDWGAAGPVVRVMGFAPDPAAP